MTIQFNTDKNIHGTEKVTEPLIEIIQQELSRYSDKITRIEVHLSDEDGNKDGFKDKRCLLEARLKGRKPIAVTNMANTHLLAVEGAIDKLKSSMGKLLND
ncbi:MAG: HPF/RaiA family ribosome-associated protein [Bacteroidota bacterium]|nr:HPF/RaiA family ribosome-associated protein [Bacteroidota bacterium]